MDDGTPDPTDPVWQELYRSPSFPETGGVSVGATTPQPEYDPNEPWSELPPLKKVSIARAWNLVEALRAGGVPVLGRNKRSGLFSGKTVDVTLSVPARLVLDANRIIQKELAGG
jgi:hypothetical protein